MLGMKYRNSLPPAVARELDQVLGSLRAILSVSLDDQGNPLAQTTATVSSVGFPVGSVVAYVGSVAPDGWLICDGSAIARASYPGLFSVIGTTWGVGNGSTTFNIPDMRGRFPLGKATSGTGSSLGSTGGLIDHVHSGPSHTHTTGAPSATTVVASGVGATVAGSAHTHTTDAQGAGNTGTANPPFGVVNFIILAQ